jgi:ligand-binding sensor domain-containing protein
MNQLITLFLIIGSFQVLVAQNSDWSSIYGKMKVLDVVERNNELWVASDIGLFQVDKTTLQYQHYTTKNSLLPSDHIKTLSVDQAQNLWIGTYDLALLKVTPNTQTWTAINYPTSIGAASFNDNKIYTSVADPNGTIWLGTQKGLLGYDGTSWEHKPNPFNAPIWDLEINSQGILKVGSLFLLSYNTTTDKWTKHAMPSDTNKILSYGDCRLLTPNDSTCFYFSQEMNFGGVHKIVNNTQWTSWGQNYTPSSQLLPARALPGGSDNWNLQLRTTPNGTLYYNLSSFSSDLLGYYDGQNWQIDNNITKQAASINKIEHFFISDNGDFWLFEENKMVCYNGTSYKKAELATAHFDPLSFIVSDQDTNIYLTNYSSGIKKKNATTWTTLVGSDNFQVKHVKFDHNNKAWFISIDANQNPIIVEQSNPTSSSWIVHDHASTSNIFPLSTNSYLIRFVDLEISTNSVLVRDNGNNIYVYKNNQWTQLTSTNNYTWHSAMTADKFGNIWWVEKYSNTATMKKYDGVGIQQFSLPHNTQLSSIYADEDGNIWTLLTTDKISKFDGTSWTDHTCPTTLNSHIINITGKNGVLFIATYRDGLFRYDGQTWTNYRASNSPLTSNNLMCLTLGKDGKLWIQNSRNNIIDIFDTNPTSTTSVDAIPEDIPQLSIFPNPATQYIQVETSLKNIETAQIVNSMGQTILNLSPNQKTIDISTLPSGIYWVMLKSKKITQNQEFVKQ